VSGEWWIAYFRLLPPNAGPFHVLPIDYWLLTIDPHELPVITVDKIHQGSPVFKIQLFQNIVTMNFNRFDR